MQVELVPLLRPYEHPTCDDIREKAFSTHSGCYIEPIEGAPSICDLSFRDWFQVVATVKYALDWKLWKQGVLQQNFDILAEGLKVFLACHGDSIALKTLQILFTIINPEARIIISAFNVANQIYDILKSKYDTEDLLIYPYIPDNDRAKLSIEYTGDVDVHVMIAQRSDYDLNYQQGKTIDMDEAVDYFLDKVSVGDFRPNIGEGVELKTYTVCEEVKCQNPNRTIEQPVFSSAYRGTFEQSTQISAFVSVLMFVSKKVL